MFELSIAFKYLTPRLRQLSVSIISLISILVIALVVWLIVVFFSVTHGLEKSWIKKLITLTAPLRITPTEEYYRSYYYLVDGISNRSNYALKTIGEKRLNDQADPYESGVDGEIPSEWPLPDLNQKGELKDLVQIAFAKIAEVAKLASVKASDFEVAAATIRLNVVKNLEPTTLSQTVYLASFDPDNSDLAEAILPLPSSSRLPASLFLQEEAVNGEKKLFLPSDRLRGDGVLLPKNYREAGARVGDSGYLAYYAPTLSAIQEQRLPIYVAGFYDPGIIPSGKFILVNKAITSLVRASHDQNETLATNGINLRFEDLEEAEEIKNRLLLAFEEAGISQYWHIETYREFEFSKDLLQQLHSERNLWTLLATVIIIVACSNIISMLIILVNDKKQEIGILRSMGANSASIAFIFGVCGVMMGMVGSIIGTIAAVITLRNLQELTSWIGKLQGHEMFNPLFYGSTLPNKISGEALLFVIVATALVSLVAGIVPAVKATMVRPSSILRSE